MVTKIKLLELMSSRMFHDLAGPIGAVSNSIEFLEEDNEELKAKALNLIKSSANESIARLKFFRQAYGTVGAQEIYLINTKHLVSDLIASSKIKVNWNIKEAPVNCYIAKAVLNLIIIAMASLIHGGEVLIEQLDTGVRMSLQGNNYVFSEDTKYLLQGNDSNIALTSANIQIYYTHMMIEAANASLTINNDDKGIEFLILAKD